MKLWIWLLPGILLVGVLELWPFRASDVAKLQPVEVLAVYGENEEITIATDIGVKGKGSSVQMALGDMKETASGMIFLETVDYLLIAPEQVALLPELSSYLRPACRVCLWKGDIKLQDVADFLDTHKTTLTLLSYLAEPAEIPLLAGKDGVMYVFQ